MANISKTLVKHMNRKEELIKLKIRK